MASCGACAFVNQVLKWKLEPQSDVARSRRVESRHNRIINEFESFVCHVQTMKNYNPELGGLDTGS